LGWCGSEGLVVWPEVVISLAEGAGAGVAWVGRGCGLAEVAPPS
jgi:hypothetical protein